MQPGLIRLPIDLILSALQSEEIENYILNSGESQSVWLDFDANDGKKNIEYSLLSDLRTNGSMQ